jgi:glycerol-3-phosphate dehydrogenase (NAD(P)+)
VIRNQEKHNPLLVLGAGSWGTALALLLHGNGVPVRLWTYDLQQAEQLNTLHENRDYLPGIALPQDMPISNDLEKLLQGIDDVLIVVPSTAFLETVLRLKSLRPHGLRIAWGTKGLDPHSNLMLHDVVACHYGRDTPVAVLSGPSFAKEVALSLPTAVSLAGNDAAFNRSLIERLHGQSFRVYLNADLVGVELCGVVKNALAIVVGMSDGIGFGVNARSALITRGLAEMSRLCLAVGGQAQTLMSLAGIGDLVLTCTDDQSRNRRFGLALAKSHDVKTAIKDIGQAVEGYSNARQLYELAQQHHVDMPIVECLYRILYEGADVKEQALLLMERSPKDEV